jgi:hypothetical protein
MMDGGQTGRRADGVDMGWIGADADGMVVFGFA